MKLKTIINHMETAFAIRTRAIAAGTDNHIVFGYLGFPGVGKTAMILQAAKKLNAQVIEWAGNSLQSTDLMATALGTEDWLVSQYNVNVPWEDIVHDERVVLFIDEATNMDEYMWKAMQKLIHQRTLGDKRLGPNVIIVLAGNRASDKAGSAVISSAVYNRVSWFDWVYDNDGFIEYLADRYEVPVLCAYLSLKPLGESDFTDALKMLGKSSFIQWASPRSVERLAMRMEFEHLKGGRLGMIEMAGDVGLGRAGEISGFFNKVDKLPSLTSIIKDPKNAKLPTEVDLQFAMIAMLLQAMNVDNFPSLAEFVQRMDVSIQVLFLKLANARKVDGKPTGIKTLVQYKNWIARDEIVDAITG